MKLSLSQSCVIILKQTFALKGDIFFFAYKQYHLLNRISIKNLDLITGVSSSSRALQSSADLRLLNGLLVISVF